MNKKNYAIVLVYACLTLIMGLVFLCDAVSVAFNWAIEKWYLVLLLYFTAGFIGIAIIKSAPIYYSIASIFVGVFLSLSFNRPFSEYWALIPVSLSVGMMVTHLVSHGKINYLRNSIILLILSVIMLAGGITHSWRYVVPAELMAVGIMGIIYVTVKIGKDKKNKLSSKDNEEDYHIRPTNENTNNEEL